jgi:fructose-bisphosphate aldolase, class II
MLTTTKKILDKAYKGRYAVGAFNINNMEICQGVVRAAEKLRSPVILQTSEGAIQYAGLDYLYGIARIAADTSNIPIALHLDHGKNWETVKKCIKIGYTSVMFDGSKLKFKENIRVTKKVVRLAHKKGVSVEAELGTIGGAEDLVSSKKIILTKPSEAQEFIEKTGCDALAIAIGTSHGAYKFKGKAQLDISRLEKINKKLRMPLVLHGASAVLQSLVNDIKKYGGDLGHPHGVPETEVQKAIKHGISKINTDTDLRLAFTAGIRKKLSKDKKEFDPRKILGPGTKLLQKTVEHRIKVFGSRRKA